MLRGKSRKIEMWTFFDSRRHQSLVLDKRPHNQPARGSVRLYLPAPAAHMSWLAGYRNSGAQVWLNFGMFQSAVNDWLQKIVSYVTLCTKIFFHSDGSNGFASTTGTLFLLSPCTVSANVRDLDGPECKKLKKAASVSPLQLFCVLGDIAA